MLMVFKIQMHISTVINMMIYNEEWIITNKFIDKLMKENDVDLKCEANDKE